MKKSLLALLAAFPLLHASAQNLGFEATTITSPPTNWTAVTGAWTITTDPNQVRTGSQAMTISDQATTGTTIGTTNTFVTVPTTGYYLITIGWGKASNATNALFHLGYRSSASANTLNPSSTASGQAPNLNDVTWSRITSVSAATVAAGTWGASLRAFKSAATPATSIYIDDIITYASLVNQPDLTAPDQVSGLAEASFALNWTNGNDAGVVQSGHDGVVIVRTDGTSALTPVLNDQAMYSASGGAAGSSSFVQNGDTWTVVASLPANTTTYTDATAISGVNYTYVVFNRDMAYNYSTGSAVTTAPPTTMVYLSSDVTQVTGNVAQGTANTPVLRIQVSTSGSLSPLSATSFALSTAGSTNAADIVGAKIYYTGNSTSFNAATLFGTQTTPSGAFTISGTQTLFPGNNYFWLAYDVSPSAAGCNALDGEVSGITLSSGTVTPNTTAPAGSRTVRTTLNGTYTIDPTQLSSCTNFQSFAEAVSMLNTFGTSGNVTFNVAVDHVYSEPPLTLNNLGTSHYIVFQSAGGGTPPLISSINGTGATDAAVTLNGSSNITFDGIDIQDDAANTTANAQMEYGYKVVNSSATAGSSSNIIKNSKITLKRANANTIGILQSASTTGGGFAATSMAGANHSNTYQDVTIENSYNGIFLSGTAGFPDTSNVITSVAGQTTIGAATAGDIGGGTTLVWGIRADNQRNVTIAKTVVRNLLHTGTATVQGIYVSNTGTTLDYGTAMVYNNLVHDIARTTTTSTTGTAHGIRIDVSITATATVYNNIVHTITSISPTTATANLIVRGITHGLAGNGNASFYHNSVSIYSTAANLSSVAFWKGGTGSAVLNNNIFSNTSDAQTGTPKHYAAYLSAGGIANTSSHNLYWATNANGFLGFATADRSGLWQWIGAISGTAPANPTDAGSTFANPNFVSTSDLNFAANTPAYTSGTPVATVTTDFSGNARNTTQPTMGAIENAPGVNDQSAPVITNVVVTSGLAPAVSADITENSASIGGVALWYRALGGTTFTAVSPDVIPVSGGNGTYTWAASFLALGAGQQYEFYIAARDIAGPGLNIGLSPAPTSGFTAFSVADPPNFTANPDAAANKWTFTKTAILPGGTYTIGATGTYQKLTNAVNALNSGTVIGDITFVLLSDYDGTTGETFPIVINPIVTTGGNWNVTFRPDAGVTARITSGAPAAGVPLISLNGADNVVFDGHPVGGFTSEWLIRSTGGTSAAVSFVNGANNDTLRYLTIESGNTSTTSGTVHISTTNEAGGNDNIMINNNKIRNRSDATGIPVNAVYSAGTAGALNNNNSILDNEIFNFTTNGVSVTATGNGDNWNINNNSFYYSDVTIPAGTQTGIYFLAASAGNSIAGNYIGGNTVQAGGTVWANSGANAFVGINASFGSTSVSTISGNTVRNISKTSTGASSFSGIRNNVGFTVIQNNLVGDQFTSNSIVVAGTGVTAGIDANNTDTLFVTEVTGNTVANMSGTNAGTGAKMRGISYFPGSVNSKCAAAHINNNIVFNLSTQCAATGFGIDVLSALGIMCFPNGFFPVFPVEIKGNTIYNITAGNTGTAATTATGIGATNFPGEISGNVIRSIKNLSTCPATTRGVATGMFIRFAQEGYVHDNMIALGEEVANNVLITGFIIAGGGSSVNTHYYYHNSVYLYNTSNAPTASSAFQRGEPTASATVFPVTLRNNIFYNAITSTGDHFAVRNNTTVPATGWDPGASNYNLLYGTDPAKIGQWGGTAYSLANWQTNTTQDAQSKSKVVQFNNATNADMHLSGTSIGDMDLAGTYLAIVPLDFDGDTRFNPPYMGADEVAGVPLPVDVLSIKAKAEGDDSRVEWAVSNERNLMHYEVEASNDASSFSKLGKVDVKNNSDFEKDYTFVHKEARQFAGAGGVVYYRIKFVEMNGTATYSRTVKVTFGEQLQPTVTVYPNPFADRFSIELLASGSLDYSYSIADMTGKLLVNRSGVAEGSTLLEVSALQNYPSGFYMLDLTLGGKHYRYKLSKK